MVSELALCTDPSSISAEVYNFSANIIVQKEQKRPVMAHFKHYKLTPDIMVS